MTHDEGVGLLGVAVSRDVANPELSLPELIFEVVTAALQDAGLEMGDVDGIVIAARDLIDGRSLSSMVTGPAAGAYLRDEIRVSEDGLTAVLLASDRIRSGEAKTVVVAAWGRASEGDPERSSLASADPFFEQPFALTDATAAALRASAYFARTPGIDTRRASSDRKRRAATNPRRAATASPMPAVAPLRSGDLGSYADARAAIVVGRSHSRERIVGIGQATDWSLMGDRDLSRSTLGAACVAAIADAGQDASALGVIEIDAASLVDEAMVVEALGLALPGRGIDALAARNSINPSGGAAAGTCTPAGGLVGLVEAVLQLRGEAGATQLPGRLATALVGASSAKAGQTATAVVVERVA